MKIFSKTDHGRGLALSTFPHYGLGFGFAGTRLCKAGGLYSVIGLGQWGSFALILEPGGLVVNYRPGSYVCVSWGLQSFLEMGRRSLNLVHGGVCTSALQELSN